MALKNKMADLNNHLFEQLERLNDEDLTDDELNKEINRSKAITDVAQTIINNANLSLNALKHVTEYGLKNTEVPEMLQLKEKND